MSKAVEQFDQHLEYCEGCNAGLLKSLCPLGCDLLLEAADDLPEEWHPVIWMLKEQDRLEREAEANVRYYAGEDSHDPD